MHDPGINAALRSDQYDICVIPCFNEGRVEVVRKIVSARNQKHAAHFRSKRVAGAGQAFAINLTTSALACL
jgi:hypothetical protein